MMEGLERLLDVLRGKLAKAREAQSTMTTVGFAAPHAAHVHEDMEMIHPRGGQAKYLEEPMRLYRKEMSDAIRRDLKEGKTMAEAQLSAGVILLEEAKKLVPVLTGELRDSGYVRTETVNVTMRQA